MILRLVFLVCLVAVASSASAAGLLRVEMADGRSYSIALPPDAAGAPLIIALHGGGGNGAWMQRVTRMADRANELGMAVAFPDGSGRSRLLTWNAGHCCAYAARTGVDDVAFLAGVIEDAAQRFGVDRRNIFVTGMSNGGMMAERLAAQRPDLIRAAASVAGPLDTSLVPVGGKVPLLMIHGTEDDFVPIGGGQGERTITREDHPSVQSVLDAWLRAFGGNPVRQTRVIDPASDGMRVERTGWTGQEAREVLVYYRVEGGGHTWPGGTRNQTGETRDIDATDVILDFFLDQMRG